MHQWSSCTTPSLASISHPGLTQFYLKFLGRNNRFSLVFAMICDKKLVPRFDCSTGQQSAEAEIPDILSKSIKFTSWERYFPVSQFKILLWWGLCVKMLIGKKLYYNHIYIYMYICMYCVMCVCEILIGHILFEPNAHF